jgi:MoxR-like ATPase
MAPNTNPENRTPMEKVLYEVKKVIVGQDHLLERMVVALLARGHILVEGVPGLAKTMAKTGKFDTSLGPVFTNLLLADEINRAPAKVQSALLEVMQERQVTIGRETFKVPDPFLVLATQNPIETEGTYALPEAQVDRFMLKVLIGYPDATEEFVIVERMTGMLQKVRKVLTTEQLLALQKEADRVYVDPALIEYAVRMVTATRKPQEVGLKDLQRYIMFGASPRASINLILTGRALAYVRGRNYVLPQDVLDMALDVMRHRIVLSYEALSDDVTGDDILEKILDQIPIPVVPLHEHTNISANA